MKKKNINEPGVRATRAHGALAGMVDCWRRLENRSVEGCVVAMSKCTTDGCGAGTRSSPFCPVCLEELASMLER